jgi:hypothetical protein
MKKYIIIIIATLVLKNLSFANVKDFNFLVKHLKENYLGYQVKTKGGEALKLKKLEVKLKRKLILYPDSCDYYYREFINFFNDGHISIRSKKRKVKKKLRDLKKIKPEEAKFKENIVDKLCGRWQTFRGDILIVKNNINSYNLISLGYKNIEKGTVLGQIIHSNNQYKAIIYSEYSNDNIEYEISLAYNNTILDIHTLSKFVKYSEDKQYAFTNYISYMSDFSKDVNTYSVSIALTDSTFFLRIPSFDISLKKQIDNTIKKYWDEITNRPYLIVDIRNNGGGLDGSYQTLSNLIYSKPYISKGVEWYSTKFHIDNYENDISKGRYRNGESGKQWLQDLVDSMKKNVGGYVIHPQMKIDQLIKKDTVYKYPKKVAIIINKNCASSTEQFILNSKHSSKTLVFGDESTAGVLDYSNTTGVELPSGKYLLKYPLSRSRRLPKYPIDGIGIKPDIIIPFKSKKHLTDKIDDWVYYVKNYLEFGNMGAKYLK